MVALTTRAIEAVEVLVATPQRPFDPFNPDPTRKKPQTKKPTRRPPLPRGEEARPRLGAPRRVGETRVLMEREQLDAALLAATTQADDIAWLVAHATSFPLLSGDEEVALATTLRSTHASAAAQAARAAARERLILSNLRLVMRMARNLANAQQERGLELTDVIQDGILGLMRAVERYDPATGNRFSTYATWWIAQAIHRAMADTGHAVRLPVYRYEQRRRLVRIRSILLRELQREPTFEEIAATFNAQPHRNGKGKTERTLTPETVAELLAVQALVVSLDAPVGGTGAFTGASIHSRGGDETALHEFLADPTAEVAYETSEQDEDARWLLDIARYALGVGKGTAEEQAKAQRGYDVFVSRALHPDLTLEVIGARYHITRERVRQIELSVNARVRAALLECGMATRPTRASDEADGANDASDEKAEAR